MIANIFQDFIDFFLGIWKILVDAYNIYFNWLSNLTSPEIATVFTIIIGFLLAVTFFLIIIRRNS